MEAESEFSSVHMKLFPTPKFAMEIHTTVITGEGPQIQVVKLFNVLSFSCICLKCSECFEEKISLDLHMKAHLQSDGLECELLTAGVSASKIGSKKRSTSNNGDQSQENFGYENKTNTGADNDAFSGADNDVNRVDGGHDVGKYVINENDSALDYSVSGADIDADDHLAGNDNDNEFADNDITDDNEDCSADDDKPGVLLSEEIRDSTQLPQHSKTIFYVECRKNQLGRGKSIQFSSQCTVCSQEFGCKAKLNLHTWNKCNFPSSPGPSDSFEDQFTEEETTRTRCADVPLPRPHRCTICRKRFTSASDLNTHSTFHTGEKHYKCSTCGKEFELLEEIKTHCRTHKDVPGEAKYMCAICDRKFVQLGDGLRKHLAFHTGEKPHVCSVCGKRFSQAGALTQHMVRHKVEKPFPCPVCGKRFGSGYNRKCHMKTHISRGEYEPPKTIHKSRLLCTECGKTFPNQSKLKIHMETHLPPNERISKPCVCPVCGKVLSRPDGLKQHMAVHEGSTFVCSVCGKSFKNEISFKRHLRTFHEGKGKTCEFCGKLFTSNYKLRVHMGTHTGEKPFTCPHCGEEFRSRSGMTMHQRKEHETVAVSETDVDDHSGISEDT